MEVFNASSVQLMDSYEMSAELRDIASTMESPTFPSAGVKVMDGYAAAPGEFPHQVFYSCYKG